MSEKLRSDIEQQQPEESKEEELQREINEIDVKIQETQTNLGEGSFNEKKLFIKKQGLKRELEQLTKTSGEGSSQEPFIEPETNKLSQSVLEARKRALEEKLIPNAEASLKLMENNEGSELAGGEAIKYARAKLDRLKEKLKEASGKIEEPQKQIDEPKTTDPGETASGHLDQTLDRAFEAEAEKGDKNLETAKASPEQQPAQPKEAKESFIEKIDELKTLNNEIEYEIDDEIRESLLKDRKKLSEKIDELYEQETGEKLRDKAKETAKDELRNRKFNGKKMKVVSIGDARKELLPKITEKFEEAERTEAEEVCWDNLSEEHQKNFLDKDNNRDNVEFKDYLKAKRKELGMSENAFNRAINQGYYVDQIKDSRLLKVALFLVPGARRYTKVLPLDPALHDGWSDDIFSENKFNTFKEEMEEETREWEGEVKNKTEKRVNKEIEIGRKIWKDAKNKCTKDLIDEAIQRQKEKEKAEAKTKEPEKTETPVKKVSVKDFKELFEFLKTKGKMKYGEKEFSGEELESDIRETIKRVNGGTGSVEEITALVDDSISELPEQRNIKAKVRGLLLKGIKKREIKEVQPTTEPVKNEEGQEGGVDFAKEDRPENEDQIDKDKEKLGESNPSEILRILRINPEQINHYEDITRTALDYADSDINLDTEENKEAIRNFLNRLEGMEEIEIEEFIEKTFGIKKGGAQEIQKKELTEKEVKEEEHSEWSFNVQEKSVANERHPEKNEDALLSDKEKNIFAVFDGLGGHRAGDVASKLARDYIEEELGKLGPWGKMSNNLEEILQEANKKILSQAQTNIEQRGMATTASVVKIIEGKAFIGNIGDSRVYIYRSNGQIEQITIDDNYVSQEYDGDEQKIRDVQKKLNNISNKGELEKLETLEKFFFNRRNEIMEFLGIEGVDIEPRMHTVDIEDGDIIIIGSDGISDNLTDEEIKQTIATAIQNNENIAESLIKASQNRSKEVDSDGERHLRAKPDDMSVIAIEAVAPSGTKTKKPKKSKEKV